LNDEELENLYSNGLKMTEDDYVVVESENNTNRNKFDESIHLIEGEEEELESVFGQENPKTFSGKKSSEELNALQQQLEKDNKDQLAMLIEGYAAEDGKRVQGLNFAKEILQETTEILKTEDVKSNIEQLKIKNIDLKQDAEERVTYLTASADFAENKKCDQNTAKDFVYMPLYRDVKTTLFPDIICIKAGFSLLNNFENSSNLNSTSINNLASVSNNDYSSGIVQPTNTFVSYYTKTNYNAPVEVVSSGVSYNFPNITWDNSAFGVNQTQTESQSENLVSNANTGKLADKYIFTNYIPPQSSSDSIQTDFRNNFNYNDNSNIKSRQLIDLTPQNTQYFADCSDAIIKNTTYTANNTPAAVSSDAYSASNYTGDFTPSSDIKNFNLLNTVVTNINVNSNNIYENSNTANKNLTSIKTESSDIESRIKIIMSGFDSEYNKIHTKIESVKDITNNEESNNANLLVPAANAQKASSTNSQASNYLSGSENLKYNYTSEADKVIVPSENSNIITYTKTEHDINRNSKNFLFDTYTPSGVVINKYFSDNNNFEPAAAAKSEVFSSNTYLNRNPYWTNYESAVSADNNSVESNIHKIKSNYHSLCSFGEPQTKTNYINTVSGSHYHSRGSFCEPQTKTDYTNTVSGLNTNLINSAYPAIFSETPQLAYTIPSNYNNTYYDSSNTYQNPNTKTSSEAEVISTGFSAAYYNGNAYLAATGTYSAGETAGAATANETKKPDVSNYYSNNYYKTGETVNSNLNFNSSNIANFVSTSNYSDYSSNNPHKSNSNSYTDVSATERSKYEEKLSETIDAIKYKKQTQPTPYTSNVEQMLANSNLVMSYLATSADGNVGFGNTKDPNYNQVSSSEIKLNTNNNFNYAIANAGYSDLAKELEELRKKYTS